MFTVRVASHGAVPAVAGINYAYAVNFFLKDDENDPRRWKSFIARVPRQMYDLCRDDMDSLMRGAWKLVKTQALDWWNNGGGGNDDTTSLEEASDYELDSISLSKKTDDIGLDDLGICRCFGAQDNYTWARYFFHKKQVGKDISSMEKNALLHRAFFRSYLERATFDVDFNPLSVNANTNDLMRKYVHESIYN